MESSTAQATQFLSVTRATAAKRIPVRCLTMLRIMGTASMLLIASTSDEKAESVMARCF